MLGNFDHDCDECVSLGGYLATNGKVYDLYCHISKGEVGPYAYTLLARYSDTPSDYQSGQAPATEALAEALTRAIFREVLLVTPNDL